MKAQVLLPKIFNFPFTYNSKSESKVGNLDEVHNGEKRWYRLKGKSLSKEAKGHHPEIQLEIKLIWNQLSSTLKD